MSSERPSAAGEQDITVHRMVEPAHPELLLLDLRATASAAHSTKFTAASTDESQYSHFTWAIAPRKQRSRVGPHDEGIALCGLLIIDPIGYPQLDKQITINDLPVGRSVEGTIRAFQFSRGTLPQFGETCWSRGFKLGHIADHNTGCFVFTPNGLLCDWNYECAPWKKQTIVHYELLH
ncbi:uncharacterized protein BXZ73DRAFT_75596 [Epithele typhae]|uniref:uncharacterized protein n=1 Tax=Epithele typhae TaxID=378194 RepID=UPI0020073DC1|nr:uncharacterized protein BXZ73DRAFT_75596 [Epithele typhae]KAH9940516.1 hypothetical protein BXZ73DRAFT_75596 [Epithele typhae]